MKIDPPAWMSAPETAAVFAALQGDGAIPAVLCVGGCVRNALLGRAVEDLDLATVFPPDEVIRRLGAAGLRAVPTGIEHGTVTAVIGGKGFEITTLRRDVHADGRHAVVEFTTDWREDARRRDFSMNTLLAGLDGVIYDPLGCALADVRAGRVAFVGNPDCRIAEDRLRVLRFFRFYGAYGDGPPDPEALAACARAAGTLGNLSRERVTSEILKILSGDDPARTLGLMFECGVMADLLPEYRGDVLRRLCALQKTYDAFCLETRVLALVEMDQGRLTSLENKMIFSNKSKEFCRAILMAIEEFSCRKLNSPLNSLLYKHGNGVMEQVILLDAACNRASGAVAENLMFVRRTARPVFPVSGKDVMAAGLASGPQVGDVLRELESWWVDQDCAPDRAALLACIRERLEKAPCSGDSEAVKSPCAKSRASGGTEKERRT
ncbi:MAG: CCA tRNA nucleotidyltransferase [Rhodospirillales bacterium]|nr:CCA tRNA nucleotidyltransferase [Rhodospirillales bacterium]